MHLCVCVWCACAVCMTVYLGVGSLLPPGGIQVLSLDCQVMNSAFSCWAISLSLLAVFINACPSLNPKFTVSPSPVNPRYLLIFTGVIGTWPPYWAFMWVLEICVWQTLYPLSWAISPVDQAFSFGFPTSSQIMTQRLNISSECSVLCFFY